MNANRSAHVMLIGFSRSGDVAGLTRTLPFATRDSGVDDSVVIVAPAALSPSSLALVRTVASAGHARIMLPAGFRGSMIQCSPNARTWKPVELPLQAEHLSRAWLPATIVDADRIIAVNEVRFRNGARPLLILGLWALFAHPRQRIGARFSDPRESLAVEIALAVRPAFNMLIFRVGNREFAVVADDQVAAELAGLAVIGHLEPERAKTQPWQDPLVQRANELGLGVNQPGQITLSIAPDGVDADFLAALADTVRMRLGLPSMIQKCRCSDGCKVYLSGDERLTT